jgi:sulfhydrogenase subunit alpha
MSRTIKLEHLARVEGHGGIYVELDGDEVTSARFEVYEGLRLLEGVARGRSYEDVATVLSRICAICSAAHSLTSLRATENAFGMEVGPQTRALRELLFLGESIASHALHLYLLAAPDYLAVPGVTAMLPQHRDGIIVGLRLKKLGNTIQGIIGGRSIHPVNAVLGGFATLPEVAQLIELRKDLLQGVSDCDAMIDFLSALPPVEICHASPVLASLRCQSDYLYSEGEEITLHSGESTEIVPVAEYRNLTNERAVGHSHALHSVFNGRPIMVGALARLSTRQDLLTDRARTAMRKLGLSLPASSPLDNNAAQAVELVLDVDRSLEIVDRIIDQGFREEARIGGTPKAGIGTAASEAPRGLLFHSYTYSREGRIESADIITPTALNAAGIEEQLSVAAAQNADAPTPLLTRKLEMLVRAYDPCISCAVHVIRKSDAL